jgi:hypothetical protein
MRREVDIDSKQLLRAAIRIVLNLTAASAVGVVVVRMAEERPQPPKEHAASSKVVQEMSSSDWNMPPNLDGTVVLYPRAIDRAELWTAAPGEVAAAVERIVDRLGIAPEVARDPNAVVLELVLVRIPKDKLPEYKARLDKMIPTEIAFEPSYVISMTARDIEANFINRVDFDSGESGISSATEPRRAFVSMLARVFRRTPPQGFPKGWRAVPWSDAQPRQISPGEWPRYSFEEAESLLHTQRGGSPRREYSPR